MRGADAYNEALFTTVRLEDFVPANHPLRPIRKWVNEALAKMDARFSAMYEADIKGGRPSIAPEKLMRAMLLQVLFSVRSERQLVEQIQYNLLFRWFVGLAIEDAVWNHSVFSKNRDRLIEHDAVTELFNATVEMADKRGLLSGEHFSVDGTLIQAWASHKSMRRKDGSDDGRPPEDWRGEPRSNDTHESTTDPESRLYRKSNAAPALPSYLGPCADRQPAWPGGQRAGQRLGWNGRARGGCADAERGRRPGQARHGRRGQGVRHQGLRQGVPGHQRHAACRAEHEPHRRQRDRWPNHSTPRLRGQPNASESASSSASAGAR
jgi:transposase